MDAALHSDLAARGVAPECIETISLVRDVLARVGDKWTVLVITALAPGPLRFTAVHEQVAGVSQRMLSQTLRLLTKDGLVTRTAYSGNPTPCRVRPHATGPIAQRRRGRHRPLGAGTPGRGHPEPDRVRSSGRMTPAARGQSSPSAEGRSAAACSSSRSIRASSGWSSFRMAADSFS
jgi:DNA-binding HxlR family transcriptional regulator